MSMRALVSIAFVASTTFVSPALAAPPPTAGLPGETPQQLCERLLRPNDPNSEFQTEPVNVGPPVLVPGSRVEISRDLVSVTPVGEPVYSNYSGYSNFHRNGGSPNVWADAIANSVVYPGGSNAVYNVFFTEDYVTNFGCRVFKISPAIEPPGLQSTGHTVTTTQAGNELVTEYDPTPYTPPGGAGTPVYNLLVCISPNNNGRGKPGDWRGQHGFNAAECPNASIIAGGTVPSGNNPD